jgi:folate-dependent phosphoribosylglycinamide formyltransferase PurN
VSDKKRVLILAQDTASTRIVYNTLRQDFEICAVVLEAPVPRKEFLQRRLKKLGARAVLGQLAFRALVVPALSMRAKLRRAEICKEYSLDTSPIDESKCIRVPSVNSAECRAVLAAQTPDLVVVNGTRIISKATLESVSARFVNIHAGLTPLYRGVHGGYWALVQGQPGQFGVTVHFVDTGIDTGNILSQGLIRPTSRDSFVTYPYLQYAVAMPLLKQVVTDLLAGRVTTLPPPDGESRLWSHPTIAQYLGNLVRRQVW